MKGIDISMHNGTIDFGKVKSAGIQVVIMKATEGVGYVDPKLEEHYRGINGKGFNVGFYHFFSEKTDPAQQAVDFWNAIKNKSFNVLPALDVETNKYNRSASQITDRCLTFLNKFKSISGYDCMIYTCGYFGRDNLDSRIKSHKGWIAHYGVSQPMETGFPVVGHQYSESGSVAGINGNVDMDNFTEGILISSAKPVINTNPESGDNVSGGIYNYEQHGNATVLVDKLNVRTAPSVNAQVVASYGKGQTIYNYDRVYENDGFRWIRYKGGSGNYRYVAVRVLSTNQKYANCY